MENTSPNCSSKSVACASSNACVKVKDNIVVLETINSSAPPTQIIPANKEISAPLNIKPLKSEVWKDFDSEVLEGSNCVKVTCKHCLRIFNGANLLGITHLKNHIKVCPKNTTNKRLSGQQLLTTKKSPNKPFKLASWKFDQSRTRMSFARMVAKHDYPFKMTEHVYFQEFVKSINPTVKLYSRNTIRCEVLKLYADMRTELQQVFDSLSTRVSLTTDLWTSEHQNIGYCCITCHYIDDEWKLQKKIIDYHEMSSPHTGLALSAALKTKLLHWNLDNKLFSITVDNASNNDVMIRDLKAWLDGKGVLISNGDLFHMRCCTHVLNLIVQDRLKAVHGLIIKISESVNFTKSSQSRKQNWKNALAQTRLLGKGVSYYVPTRWNSTYLMLESAIEVCPAFERLVELTSNYISLPSREEWEIGKEICEYLKIFYDATLKFSGVKYPTANLYFKSVCDIDESITSWELSEHDYICSTTQMMRVKFEKYWKTCNLMMSIGMVFDPHYRMAYIEFFYDLIYGEDAQVQVRKINDCLKSLFYLYEEESASYKNVSSSYALDDNVNHGLKKRTKMDLKWKNYREQKIGSLQISKTELDKYLKDELLPMDEDDENFDILMWWKTNCPTFPTLAKIARDILAVPVSTIAFESSFSSSGRLIIENRSLLSPDIVEALSCIKDWLPSDIGKDIELVDEASTLT